MGRGPGFCPSCGERVSPFAAGCALCGADLDARRRASSRVRLPHVALPRGRLGDTAGTDLVVIALLVGLTLFATSLGLLFALYTAYVGNREGRPAKCAVAIAFALTCLLLLASPVARIDLLSRLGLA
jgi:hypothetical protein